MAVENIREQWVIFSKINNMQRSSASGTTSLFIEYSIG